MTIDKHQLRIAEDTIRMPAPMRGVMGGPSLEEARDILFRAIEPGDRVTILSPQKQLRGGRAVMGPRFTGHNHWVLNMGGPHGTPGICTRENIVRVRKAKKA